MKKLWIEQYKGCGCSVGPLPESDLPGYCATHGSDVLRRYPLPGYEMEREAMNENDLREIEKRAKESFYAKDIGLIREDIPALIAALRAEWAENKTSAEFEGKHYDMLTELIHKLEEAGMGQPGKPNTLYAMVEEICAALAADQIELVGLKAQVAELSDLAQVQSQNLDRQAQAVMKLNNDNHALRSTLAAIDAAETSAEPIFTDPEWRALSAPQRHRINLLWQRLETYAKSYPPAG